MAIVRYTQLEAIHEAMRELEGEEMSHEALGVTFTHFDSYDVRRCLAKIRAALAGDSPESNAPPFNLFVAGRAGPLKALLEPVAVPDEADERMVRPEDVAPPIAERSDEDSKTTWQG